MKSNDNIPEDEMLLAEAIAAAKGRGMEFCSGAMFTDVHGFHLSDEGGVPRNARACCAMGAIRLARKERSLSRDFTDSVMFGNDYSNKWFSEYAHENPDRHMSHDDNGESLGWAFRCAMTQEEG